MHPSGTTPKVPHPTFSLLHATGILSSTKIRKRGRNTTWRGQRTPRGQGPYHTPRGGRSEYTDRHRDRNRESGSIREKRDNLIEQGLCQVLRKQGGVQTERDHDFPLQDHAFEIGPRHLSYLFRHTDLLHEDGSLSLHEMINHVELPEKSEQCTTVALTD